MTSDILFFFNLSLEKKRKRILKGSRICVSGSLENRRNQGCGLQTCLHTTISWGVILTIREPWLLADLLSQQLRHGAKG